jgi:hypothetical protein
MAHALQNLNDEQLALDARWSSRRSSPSPVGRTSKPLCAWCRGKEARYGFRQEGDDPNTERPRTLCFECFRMEIGRRQSIAERMARAWRAEQVRLPLEETLNELSKRRRRAQIAARHALGA